MVKKKILMVGLVLALALGVVAPVPALAAKPVGFYASGIINYIATGEEVIEFPAGNSGRWVVQERVIAGILDAGDIGGGFVLTYKANVVLETQAGSFHGKMVINEGEYVINVNGQSSIGTTPIGFPGLILSGHWVFPGSNQGNGNFTAWIIPDTDIEGHIIGILYSGITMTGQWKP